MSGTVVEVDLDAIAHNAAALREAAQAELIAVVKADAYGHGAEAVAHAAVEAGAAMLAVATIDEAVLLRNAGIDAPVLILLGASTREEADAALAHGLVPVLWDIPRAELLAEAARAARTTVKVHFKVDTGLTRLGSPLDEAAGRLRVIGGMPELQVDGVLTHFASADDADPSFALEQLARFERFIAEWGHWPRWVHAAASAGVAALGVRPVCNAIRPGLALYGLPPAPHLEARLPLRAALSWRSAVHRVADVPAGTGVSYGLHYRLSRAGRIATVPLGYGDGLPRSALGGSLLIGGAPAPIVGRVCMDLVMADVTGRAVHEGDEVVVIGEQDGSRQSADDLAAMCGTISYEVVTNIRARVPRRYVRGSRLAATRTLGEGFRWC